MLSGFVVTAPAQTTIFNENFDGGYTGTFGTSAYSGGSPTGTGNAVQASGGNQNGCWRETMTATTSSDYYTGRVQLMTVSGNTDPNPSDYVLLFDAYGSQAANIQLIVETWSGNYFGGTRIMDAIVNNPLTAANTWQTFSVNLGSIAGADPTGATWQLNFQINASQWGGAGFTDTLIIDNIKLVNIGNPIGLTSSFNPSSYGGSVTFNATVVTNGTIVGNATGMVVFSSASGPFSTNTVSGGSATSLSMTNLPVGTDLITAVYSGGNYPGSTNTLEQTVATAPGIAQANLLIYTDNLVNGFQNWSWATVNVENSSPVHSGAYSISVTDGGYQALSLRGADFNTGPYASLSFWINGGSAGGQQVQVCGLLDGTNQAADALVSLPSNAWRRVAIPLSTLGVAN